MIKISLEKEKETTHSEEHAGKREAQKVVYLLPQHPLSIRKAPEEEDWPKQQQLWGRTDVAEFSRTRSVALLVCENKKKTGKREQ